MGSSNFHLVGDPCGMRVERSTEYARECERIVDLVGVFTAPVPTTAAPGSRASWG